MFSFILELYALLASSGKLKLPQSFSVHLSTDKYKSKEHPDDRIAFQFDKRVSMGLTVKRIMLIFFGIVTV